MVDWYGTPHTEALHVIWPNAIGCLIPEAAEELERDARRRHNVAKGMRNPNSGASTCSCNVTVEDKGVFATPWTATMTYGSGGGSGPADWAEELALKTFQGSLGKDAYVPAGGQINSD